MDVTISIINYNYGRFLRKAIQSALAQECHNITIEVRVIDDGSTDESDNIALDFSDYSNFYFSKTENKGFAFALTRAIVEARGTFVFLMDADDYFSESKVSEVIPYLQKNYLYVSDYATYINEDGQIRQGKAWGSTSTVAVNKQAVLPLLPVENELSFMTLYKIGRGIVLEKSLTYYRFHNKSMTDRKQSGKQQTYLAKITHNLSDRLVTINSLSEECPWNGITKKKVEQVANEFRSQAYYNELEATLERREIIKAYKSYFKMIIFFLKSREKFSFFHCKMLVRTILLKPSFPK